MSCYRRKYFLLTGGKKIPQRSRYWTIELRGPDQIIHRRSTRLTDRKAALAAEAELRLEIERGSVGLIDPFAKTSNTILPDIIKSFESHLRGLGRDVEYCNIVGYRLRRIIDKSDWMKLSDITLTAFEKWRRQEMESGANAKTVNQFAGHLRQLLKYSVEHQLIRANPIQNVTKLAEIDNPNFRRASSETELNTLINTAPPRRRLFYMFVLYTPLRRRTLENIVWGDLTLGVESPFILIRPEIAKSRKAERSAIRREIAALLLEARGDAKDSDLVFPNLPTVKDLKEDLIAAGIPFDDGHGNRRMDLHSFRKTLVGLMKAQGLSIETASLILHHKDLRTTRKHYDAAGIASPLTDAVEKLPRIGMGV